MRISNALDMRMNTSPDYCSAKRIFEIREARIDPKYPYVEGYAVVFDKFSVDLGGFREIIHKGAITEELVRNSDIFCRLNHEDLFIYARSNKGKGDLQLTLDDKGLKYKFMIPDIYYGETLQWFVYRGDLCKSSFAFGLDVNPDNEFWEWDENQQTAIRHIYHIDALYDVSPVWVPAYNDTCCYLSEK